MTEALVLASASPRRALILRSLGLAFRVVVSDVEEIVQPGEKAEQTVERLAREKASAVARLETLPVLGADTVVAVGDEILGKPGSPQEAAAMLRALAAREHDVLTGLCLVRGGKTFTGVERTVVRFAPMTEDEIAWYVSTGESMDKAGAYHIDGRGALFVDAVSGSPSNVAGLPVRLLYALARQAGLDLASERV